MIYVFSEGNEGNIAIVLTFGVSGAKFSRGEPGTGFMTKLSFNSVPPDKIKYNSWSPGVMKSDENFQRESLEISIAILVPLFIPVWFCEKNDSII